MDEKNLPAKIDESQQPWRNLSEKSKQAIALANSLHKTKTGLFANIPMVCKAEGCPYDVTCPALQAGLAPEGERCPIEIADIVRLYEDLIKDLQIEDERIINLGLVRQVIEADIIIQRCNSLLAKDPNILQEVSVGVTPKGDIITKPEPHSALAIRSKAYQEKNTALQLLNSTPKDKAKMEGMVFTDPSTYATQIANKYRNEINITPIVKEIPNEPSVQSKDQENND